MANSLRAMALGIIFAMALGCDTGDRLSRLEKQVQELQAADE
jgi:hypothetical protein